MAAFDSIVSSGEPTLELLGGDDEGGGFTAGGRGRTGDLVLRDESGRLRIWAHAGTPPFLRLGAPDRPASPLHCRCSSRLTKLGNRHFHSHYHCILTNTA